MADLKFDIAVDAGQVPRLLASLSDLKNTSKDLDSTLAGLNQSLGSGNAGMGMLEKATARTRIHVQGLHKDLQDILGDISNVQLKGGLLGDISNVGLKSGLGNELTARKSNAPGAAGPGIYDLDKHLELLGQSAERSVTGLISNEEWMRRVGVAARETDDELEKFINTVSEVINRSQDIPSENWLEYKQRIAEADEELDKFIIDLGEAIEESEKLESVSAAAFTAQQQRAAQERAALRRKNTANLIADTPFTGANLQFGTAGFMGGGPADSIRDYESLLKGLGGTEDEIAGKTTRAANALEHKRDAGRKATLAIVELSRGAEDFAVTLGPMGVAGALRSSINNFSQFAFILHPMLGAVAGVAGAITAALIPALFQADDEAKKTTQSLKDLIMTSLEWQRVNIQARRMDPEYRAFEAPNEQQQRFGGNGAAALRNAQQQKEQLERELREISFNRENRNDMLENLRLSAEDRAGFATEGPGWWRRNVSGYFGRGIDSSEQADYLSSDDIRQFMDAAVASRGEPGAQVLNKFMGDRMMAGRGKLSADAENFLAEQLAEVQRLYAENANEIERGVGVQQALNKAIEDAKKRQEEVNAEIKAGQEKYMDGLRAGRDKWLAAELKYAEQVEEMQKLLPADQWEGARQLIEENTFDDIRKAADDFKQSIEQSIDPWKTQSQKTADRLEQMRDAIPVEEWDEVSNQIQQLDFKERTKAFTDALASVVDDIDPSASGRRAMNETVDSLRNSGVPNALAGMDAARNVFAIDENLRQQNEEFDKREEMLRQRAEEASQSLQGRLTGIEELNRRITEAAGGGRKKDEAAEELKKLREERKAAEKRAEDAKRVELELLREQLTAIQKGQVGLAG